MRLKNNLVTYVLVVIGLVGVAALLYATSGGIGAYNDSARYVDFARNLSSGRGLGVLNGDGEVTHDPGFLPLYPALLAVPGFLGVDPLDGARPIQALLFGANILLIGVLVYRCTNHSFWMAVLASLIMLTSVDMLHVHSVAWTEALFIFCGFLGLLLLNSYLQTPRAGLLVAASIAIGLAVLDRYIGIALVATGVVGVVLFGQSSLRKRVRDLATFVCITCLPVCSWVIGNAYFRSGSRVVGRTLAWHPITLTDIRVAAASVSVWLLPTRVPENIRLIALFPIVALLSTFGIILLMWGGTFQRRRLGRSGSICPIRLLLVFAVTYLGFILIARSFFDATIPLNYRLLSPLFPVALVLILSLAHRVVFDFETPSYVRVVFVVLSMVFVGYYAVRGSIWVLGAHETGRGLHYSSNVWRESRIIREIEALPSDMALYSNGREVIYLLTGRPVHRIPVKTKGLTTIDNRDYSTQLDSMEEHLREGAILVYFNAISFADFPSEEELEATLSLELLERAADGSIYGAEN